MASHLVHLLDVTGRRRGWTPIAVEFTQKGRSLEHLVELAKARQWRLLNLATYAHDLPRSLPVRGALVDLPSTSPALRAMVRRGIPVVRIGGRPPRADHGVASILLDRTATGRMAAEHFIGRGFRNVAYVGRDPWFENHPLYQAFAAQAQEAGCVCHLLRESERQLARFKKTDPRFWRNRQKAFTRWLIQLPRPVGLLAFGDIIADRYCQWAIDAGLRIPEDVAVLGMGNQKFVCESATVPLSSVAHDEIGMMDAAATMLERLMTGRPPKQTTVLVPSLGVVTRQSTDMLAASDPHVIKALRFIWDHVVENLSIDTIARQVAISRRGLERAFRRDLDRGIAEEMQRRRMEKAHELITLTSLPIAEVAQSLSFSSQSQFGRVFRRAFGVSPARYRQQAHRSP